MKQILKHLENPSLNKIHILETIRDNYLEF